MKTTILCAAFVAVAASAAAQNSPPAKDGDLPGLTTPVTVAQNKYEVGLQFNAFGASDNLLRSGISLKYGIANNWEARLIGVAAHKETDNLSSGASVNYGGSDTNFVLKYRMPGTIDTSFEVGLGYADTPAQNNRLVSLFGASAGYSIFSGARVYVNPKLVALQDNAILGVSVGAVVDIASGISLYGVWTPVFDGDNYISESDGTASRQQLYSMGIRFAKLSPGLSVDVGYTNMIGETYGFSLTPSLGNTGGLYVGLTYRQ